MVVVNHDFDQADRLGAWNDVAIENLCKLCDDDGADILDRRGTADFIRDRCHARAAKTARREIAEETGHPGEPEELDLEQSFMIESHYLETLYPTPIIASETGFVARLSSSAPIHIDAEEHDDFGWFTFGEAYERIRWTDDREALERLEARIG